METGNDSTLTMPLLMNITCRYAHFLYQFLLLTSPPRNVYYGEMEVMEKLWRNNINILFTVVDVSIVITSISREHDL